MAGCAFMVDEWVRQHSLQPHPEGGWYRETWRKSGEPNERAAATAILYALNGGGKSHWHRVDADELWLWHGGSPLRLAVAPDENGPVQRIVLGNDPALGYQPQHIVPAGWWQSAEAGPHGALVSCIVVPGFDFSGFDLAPPGWQPAG